MTQQRRPLHFARAGGKDEEGRCMVKAWQRSKMAGSMSQRAVRDARKGMGTSLPLGDGGFCQERARGLTMGV